MKKTQNTIGKTFIIIGNKKIISQIAFNSLEKL